VPFSASCRVPFSATGRVPFFPPPGECRFFRLRASAVFSASGRVPFFPPPGECPLFPASERVSFSNSGRVPFSTSVSLSDAPFWVFAGGMPKKILPTPKQSAARAVSKLEAEDDDEAAGTAAARQGPDLLGVMTTTLQAALERSQEAQMQAMFRFQQQMLTQQHVSKAAQLTSPSAQAAAYLLGTTLALVGPTTPEVEAVLRAYCSNLEAKGHDEAKERMRQELKALDLISRDVNSALDLSFVSMASFHSPGPGDGKGRELLYCNIHGYGSHDNSHCISQGRTPTWSSRGEGGPRRPRSRERSPDQGYKKFKTSKKF